MKCNEVNAAVLIAVMTFLAGNSAFAAVSVADGVATLEVASQYTDASPYVMTPVDAAEILRADVMEFHKTGEGYLAADAANASLAAFTGVIRVKAGVYRISAAADLGTSSGATYVESGATLEKSGSQAVNVKNETFYIEGTGAAGMGAIDANGGQVNIGSLILTANATVRHESDVVIRDRIDLAFKTLDLVPKKAFTAVNAFDSSLGTNVKIVNGGHVFYDRLNSFGQSGMNLGFKFEGGPECTFNAGGFVNYVPYASNTPWTWVVINPLNLRMNNGTATDFPESAILSTNTALWGGPAVLNADVTLGNEAATDGRWQIAGFKGPVSGAGIISTGMASKPILTWFKFGSANPNWTGSISAKRDFEEVTNASGKVYSRHTGIALFADGALTQNALELKNAELALAGSDPVINLPDVVTEGYGRIWGSVTGKVGRIQKIGGGVLHVAGMLHVTNKLSVASGALMIDVTALCSKIYSRFTHQSLGLAGLLETMYVEGESTTNGPAVRAEGPVAGFFDGNNDCVHRTVLNKYATSGPGYDETLYWWKGRSNMTVYRYDGYLWNRSPENVTWGFMSCGNSSSEIWLENSAGELQRVQKGSYFGSTQGVINSYAEVVLKPGPNRIALVMKGNSGASAGANIASSLGLTGDIRPWSKTRAFSYDPDLDNTLREGLWTQTSYEAFDPLLDAAGEGTMFTTVPYTEAQLIEIHKDEISAELEEVMPYFAAIEFADGTSIDLVGLDPRLHFNFHDVSGFPSITGGNVKLNGTWRFDGAALQARTNCVDSTGMISFAPDSRVLVDDSTLHGKIDVMLFHAEGGFSGTLPQIAFVGNKARAQHTRFVLSADRKSLRMVGRPGLLIDFH